MNDQVRAGDPIDPLSHTVDREFKSVWIAGGARLHYAEQGDSGGIPVLLLHGYVDSWRSFEPVLAQLPHTLHVIAVSQRGHGDSDAPSLDYRPRHLAADAAAFMDAVGIDRAVIVGHSMGSVVAQQVAIDHPARTLGLVLLGSSPRTRGNPALQELWDSTVSTLSDPVEPAFVRAFQASTLARTVPDVFFASVVQESRKVRAEVWIAALAGLLDSDTSTELHRIGAATLIVWGDQDGLFVRAEQESLAAAIRGARLLVYRGCGHAPHWEEPARFAGDLTTFVQDLMLARKFGR